MYISLEERVFKTLAKLADTQKVECYVVGGFVRDRLLGRPSKDIDIVVLGSGIEFAEKFAETQLFPKLTVFKNFGTAQVVTKSWEIEFVGARKESYSRDSRKPIVEDGTLEDDQNRRDFTINALAARLSKKDFGKVIDPFNGMEDLRAGIIRTPLEPDKTFSDDPLRMMRAARFASQLGFTIEESTFNSMTKNAERLEIISQERITTELNKIVLSPKPSVGFKILYSTNLLQEFFLEMVSLQGVEVIKGKRHKDNFYHTLEVLDNVAKKSDNLWLRWAAILHDIAKPATKRFDEKVGWTFHGHEDKGARMVKPIFKRLKLPLNDKMRYVEKLVRLHLRPIALVKSVVTDSAVRRLIVDAGEDVDDLLLLCQCDITSKIEEKKQRYLQNLEEVRQKIKDVTERDQLRNFQPPISGNHIKDYFEIVNPKHIGAIKEFIREAILEGEVPNEYEPCYELMVNRGRELGLNEKVEK